jgi:hypothetical protein
MASVLHGSARTTPCLRAEFQASQESTRSLAARYGVNAKTVKKWRSRTTTADAPMGPKTPKSTVLTPAEEAIVVAFRQKTLLPLDDVLGCLRDTIPNLSRSALHRCLQRHGISRLPVEETKEQRKRFKTYEIGYVHIDSCELRHADGKLVMFLAIDRGLEVHLRRVPRQRRQALTADAALMPWRCPGTDTTGVCPLAPHVVPCTASTRKPDPRRQACAAVQESQCVFSVDRQQHEWLDLDRSRGASDSSGVPDLGAAESGGRQTAVAEMFGSRVDEALLIAGGAIDRRLEPEGAYFAERREGQPSSLPPPVAFAMTKLPCLAGPLFPRES